MNLSKKETVLVIKLIKDLRDFHHLKNSNKSHSIKTKE